MRAHRVILETVRRADGRPEIEEGVHIDLIEKDAKTAPHHKAGGGLISKAETRGEVISIRRKDRIDPSALHHQALTWNKDAKIFLAIAVQRSEILVIRGLDSSGM
jgi:hypothetical protein